jgi:ABC-type polysaccharide/polyol phosphate export permease
MSETALHFEGTAQRPQVRRRWNLAWLDLRETLTGWRLWATLGANDIAQRYRRSKVGQFWITLSMATFIAMIGSIYSVLFRTELQHQLPHVVVYYTAWIFLSQSFTEGASGFIDAERYLRQERLPKLAFVMRVVWRNALAYLHNIVLIPVTFLIFGIGVGGGAFVSLLGLALAVVNVSLLSTIFAVICTRFRDVRQVVQNITQIAFFASPIMWRPEILPESARAIVDLNPVALHLRLIGDPLLGREVPFFVIVSCAVFTLVLVLVVVPLFVRFRERIVYWL